MAVEEDTKDPFAPAAPTELLDPAHAALEENLAQVMTSLSTLTNCQSCSMFEGDKQLTGICRRIQCGA